MIREFSVELTETDRKRINDAVSVGRVVPEPMPGRKTFAETAGYTITQIAAPELARWKKATDPLDDAWVDDINKRGGNGKAMLDDARALIKQYTK